jgi:hypothetical protein
MTLRLLLRGCIQKFSDWVDNEITTINTRWEAIQRVMAAKLTRLTHKIVIQLHLVAESCIICSSRSRRPVRKLLDTPSYTYDCTYCASRLSVWTSCFVFGKSWVRFSNHRTHGLRYIVISVAPPVNVWKCPNVLMKRKIVALSGIYFRSHSCGSEIYQLHGAESSWEANRHSISHTIYCLLRNPKIHWLNSPPLDPILSQMNPVHNLPSYFSKTHSSIRLPSMSRYSSKCCLPFRFSELNFVCIFQLSHVFILTVLSP